MRKRGLFVISPMLIFLLCLGLYFGKPKFVLLILAAALCHEAAHFLFLLTVRKPPKKLAFLPGRALLETKPLSYGEELACAICGPATNLLLCLLLCKIAPIFSGINLGLGLYNLLPIYPLDGGRVLRSALLLHLEESRARAAVFAVNFAVSLILMFLTVWLCAAIQCTFWLALAVGVTLWKLDLDAGREWS